MDYTIVEDGSAVELSTTVLQFIALGWSPLGGPFVTSNTYTNRDGDVETSHWFHQAMTRPAGEVDGAPRG